MARGKRCGRRRTTGRRRTHRRHRTGGVTQAMWRRTGGLQGSLTRRTGGLGLIKLIPVAGPIISQVADFLN